VGVHYRPLVRKIQPLQPKEGRHLHGRLNHEASQHICFYAALACRAIEYSGHIRGESDAGMMLYFYCTIFSLHTSRLMASFDRMVNWAYIVPEKLCVWRQLFLEVSNFLYG
jgi:hypothetical protein